jgi:hypothetical protein
MHSNTDDKPVWPSRKTAPVIESTALLATVIIEFG